MSSGNFKDAQFKLKMMHESLCEFIDKYEADFEEDFQCGQPLIYFPITVEKFKQAHHHLAVAAVYMKRINLLVSGEDGELNFHAQLKEELEALGE